MHSVGKFEDYKPASYWRKMIESCGFKVIIYKEIKQRARIPSRVLREMVKNIVKTWKALSVSDEYIRRLYELLESAETLEMRWSDLIMIVGER